MVHIGDGSETVLRAGDDEGIPRQVGDVAVGGRLVGQAGAGAPLASILVPGVYRSPLASRAAVNCVQLVGLLIRFLAACKRYAAAARSSCDAWLMRLRNSGNWLMRVLMAVGILSGLRFAGRD